MGNPGQLFIISAPSGAGKSTLCKALLGRFPDLLFSVSHTTRRPRPGETHGVEYFFTTKEDFVRGIEKSKWAEWAEVHGNFYGTSAEFLDKKLKNGEDVLLDIDVQGTIQILGRYPDSTTIFIMPPSLDILRSRLASRKTESQEVIEARFANAEKEMAEKHRYRHVIVNDVLEEAIAELISLVETCRSARNQEVNAKS